jgi:CMP-N-acetylneuraminic acid synthetase
MKITVLIPMKGNSERVPNKNLRLFDGKPLYHAIVSELLKSKYINQLVINTDSDKIKEDVRKNFPTVICVDRPTAIQGDFVPMNEIIAYDMSQVPSEIYIQTHSTNPLLNSQTLDSAIERFVACTGDYDSLFSVTQLQTRLYWEDGSAVNHNPQELLRTQDLPPVFEENSNFFIFTKASFEANGGKRIGLRPLLFPMNKIEAQDIDEPEDFIIAENLYKIRHDLR